MLWGKLAITFTSKCYYFENRCQGYNYLTKILVCGSAAHYSKYDVMFFFCITGFTLWCYAAWYLYHCFSPRTILS